MLKLCISNRLEVLADALADAIGRRASPLDEVRIAAPNRPIERFVELHVARRLGIASGLRFERLEAALAHFLTAATGSPLLSRTEIEGRLLEIFTSPAAAADPALAPVARWLDAGGSSAPARERRVVALAEKLAGLFTEYDTTRPELVRSWLLDEPVRGPSSELAAWQAALLRAVRFGHPGPGSDASSAITMAEALAQLERGVNLEVPLTPLYVLGVSSATRAEHAALAALARSSDVFVYTIDPCREFWEDAEAPRAAARRLLRARAAVQSDGATDEDDVLVPDSGLLGGWGRPAREHLAVLRELSAYGADERWVVPAEGSAAPSVLEALGRSLLERGPARASAPDASVRFFGCPSVRREVETVAREIWAALAEADAAGAPLAFSDVAVLLHDDARARYLPHLEAVFGEARAIPWSSRDLSFTGTSAVAQAALALVTFVSSDPTRVLLFDVILSPVVLGGHPGATRERWASLVDGVGFLRGLSAADHAGTYVGVGAASLDLEQAIARLALGALMPGERSGDARFVPVEPPLLPEEIAEHDEAALDLVMVLRSLGADVRFARNARLLLSDWARFFGAMFSAYLAPRTRSEEAELARASSTLAELVALDRPGLRVGIAAAAEIVTRALGAMTTQRSAPGITGVSVGSLRALRALPFRLVFVLGLGEGRFPARDEESGLDVRDAAPRVPGDVRPAERDRLAMLETVLAARGSLVLSWVARAEDSGDPISPSSVVLELAAELGAAAPPIVRPPLRRHDGLEDGTLGDRARLAALPSALAEESARSLGDRERDPAETWPRAADAVRGLSEGDGLRSLLSWPRVEAAPVDATATVEVSLAELKSFLDRPLQATAARALGLGDGDVDTERDDEPLDAGSLERIRIVERALTLHLREPGLGVAARVAHECDLLRARGRFPLGVLGDRERAALREIVEDLGAGLRAATGRGSESAPVVIFAARLGRGRRARDGVERVSDPVALGALRDGRKAVLSGETGLLLDIRQESVVFSLGAPGTGAAGSARRTRAVLRAFVDHAALAAAGLSGAAARTVWLVHPGAVFRGVLEPIEAAAARAWLRGLAAELGRGHAAFLPIEAVLDKLDVVRGRSSRPADELHRSVERIREKKEGGSERFGPVRDALVRDGLDPSSLLRTVGARFGPFVEHLRALDLVELG